MYLFAAMRPASMASEEICSFSKLRKAFLEARGRRVVSDGWRGNTFRIEEPLNALFISPVCARQRSRIEVIEAVYRGAEVRLGHPPSRRKTQCVAAETLKAAFGFPYMAIGFGSGTASRGARVFPFFIHGHAPHALTQHTHQRSPIRSSQFAVGQTRRAFRYLGLEKLVARCVRKKRWGSDVPHEVDAGGEDVAVEFLHAGIVNADLGIRDTAAVPAFRVRLVLNDAVALAGRRAMATDGRGLPCAADRG
eukprot:CAMPEP_0117623928 /NCGR_PEP_ID=MMETSP0802-20121206/87_1 /TAXON_ID=38833 /ORGANISM="Micromonas sp., Strain CCMP2099" /LENGTH=249 /DNA_ID=CAMNT_0005427891 /DNA_START=30 /DNA_END=778 /DNA_ORIENTATION=-